jgi:hypothetical protein
MPSVDFRILKKESIIYVIGILSKTFTPAIFCFSCTLGQPLTKMDDIHAAADPVVSIGSAFAWISFRPNIVLRALRSALTLSAGDRAGVFAAAIVSGCELLVKHFSQPKATGVRYFPCDFGIHQGLIQLFGLTAVDQTGFVDSGPHFL